MKLLISNDDGIWADGIRSLIIALADDHEVYACAPDRERSATGHSMSLHKPLMVTPAKTSDITSSAKAAFMTSGTPADCVKISTGALFKEIDFDLMISGINHGPNLGIDVLYSGTVSAAMEAMLYKIPSIACSLNSYTSKDFDDAAQWVKSFIESHDLPKLIPERTFLNINIPPGPMSEYQGVEVTKLGNRAYTENYEEREDPRGNKYFWLAGAPVEGLAKPSGDSWAVLNRKVSISPVVFDMTYYDYVEPLGKEFNV